MRLRDDEGFTLIEMLVTIVILGIISAAIVTAIIVGLRTTDDTGRRLSESHDAQLVQVYVPNDVQSATFVSSSDTACTGTDPVVMLRWTDGAVTKVASYVVESAAIDRKLVRTYCENGTQVRSFPVAHHLGGADPVVTCAPACDATFRSLRLDVTEAGGYAYSVSATRRAS